MLLSADYQEYQPEMWNVKKDAIYAAITAVTSGLEYAREALVTHDVSLGRTTHKNRSWAKTMENDIRQMEHALSLLKECNSKT